MSFSSAVCFALSSKTADYFGLADRTVIGIFSNIVFSLRYTLIQLIGMLSAL